MSHLNRDFIQDIAAFDAVTSLLRALSCRAMLCVRSAQGRDSLGVSLHRHQLYGTFPAKIVFKRGIEIRIVTSGLLRA